MPGWSTVARKRFSTSTMPIASGASASSRPLSTTQRSSTLRSVGEVDPAEAAVGEAAAHLVLARDEGAGGQLRQEREPLAVLGAEAFGAAGPVAAAAADGVAALAAEPAVLGHLRVGHQRGDGVDARHRGHVDEARRRACRGWSRRRSCGRHGRSRPAAPGCPPAGCLPPTAPPGRTGRAPRCPRRSAAPRRRCGGPAAPVGGPAAAVPDPAADPAAAARPRLAGAAGGATGGGAGPGPRAVGGPAAAVPGPDAVAARGQRAPTPHRGPRPPPGGRTRRSSRRR